MATNQFENIYQGDVFVVGFLLLLLLLLLFVVVIHTHK